MTTIVREPDELWIPIGPSAATEGDARRPPPDISGVSDVVATVVAGATLMFLLGYVVGRAVGRVDV